MDVFLSCGCAVGLVHFLDVCLAFEISDKRPRGGSDAIIYTLDRFSKRLFLVLIDFRLSHEGADCSSVLVQGRHELGSQHLRFVLMESEQNTKDRVLVLQVLHVLEVCGQQVASELIEEVSIAAVVLSHMVRVLIKDAVIVHNQVVDQVDNFPSEPHVEIGI